MEVWKGVGGHVGLYQVSNRGRVKSFWKDKNGQMLMPIKAGNGYLVVNLCRDGKRKTVYVHRLVIEAFLGNAPSPNHQVNHKNGDRTDNRVENLEWVTPSENNKHAFRALDKKPTNMKGEANGNARLNDRMVRQIRKFYASGNHTYAELAKMFGVCQATIGYIVRRETWKHVP